LQNLEAYELYLRAYVARQRFTKDALDESDAYLERALQIDPNYGIARMLMAYNAGNRSDSGFVPPAVGFGRQRELALEVLELSSDSASAHSALMHVYRTLDWDWAAAESVERRALALDPNDMFVQGEGGILAATLGQWDEAERKIRGALARDPLDSLAIWCLALTYYNAQRYTDAEATLRRLIDLWPDFVWTRAYLGKTLLAQGKPREELEATQQEADEWVRLWFLPLMHHAVGHTKEADEALNALIARSTEGSGPYFVAMNYAYLNEKELAFERLERAYRERDFALVEIVGEALFRNIAKDPRFTVFLTRMKLPTEWTSQL